jgi:RNA polymerase sigma-70 factor, ECF subfamily
VNEIAARVVLDDVDRQRVRRVLFLHGLHRSDIDDVLQQVELRLLERTPAALSSARAWACAVASNLAVDTIRSRQRRDSAEQRFDVSRSLAADDAALRLAVRAELARLEPELVAVLVLRFYADLTVPDIAVAMALPEGTVKSRLHRATSRLRDALPKEVIAP